MATIIGALSINVRANTKNFSKGMKSARKTLGNFTTSIGTIGRQLAGFSAAAGAAGATIATAMVKSQLTAVEAISRTSDKLGIQTEQLVALQHAGKLSGVGVETMNMALQRMTRRLSEAGMGGGEALGAIKELGLDAERLSRLSPDMAFRDIAEAMSGVSNQSDRVRLAFKFFDSEGVSLVNTLQGGAAAIDAAAKETQALGQAFSNVDAAQVVAANNAMRRIQDSIGGVTRQLAIKLAPFIEAAANKMLGLAKETDGVGAVVANMVDFSVKGLGVFLDTIDTVRLAFQGLQVATLKWAAFSVGAYEKVISGLEQIAVFAGLDVDPSSNFLTEFSKSLTEQADMAGKDWWASFLQDPPSKRLESFISKITEASRIAAENSVADVAGGALTDTAEPKKIRGSITAGALQRGSVEAFQAINRKGEAKDLAKIAANGAKQLTVERKQTAVLERIERKTTAQPNLIPVQL